MKRIDADWDDVETLLESDLEDFDGELGQLYDRIERYSRTANVLESENRDDDAEYFREVATRAYESFSLVVQLKKYEEGGEPGSL